MASTPEFDSIEREPELWDEEACRDFLVHDLGFDIPYTYRYAEGVHQVYQRLLVRYGDANFARALGVFHALLEDDNAAGGVGDDGDSWRSWRHDHRMRRLDLSNPGTPRFGSMVLPSPIPPKGFGKMKNEVDHEAMSQASNAAEIDERRFGLRRRTLSTPMPGEPRSEPDSIVLEEISTRLLLYPTSRQATIKSPAQYKSFMSQAQAHSDKQLKTGLRRRLSDRLSNLFRRYRRGRARTSDQNEILQTPSSASTFLSSPPFNFDGASDMLNPSPSEHQYLYLNRPLPPLLVASEGETPQQTGSATTSASFTSTSFTSRSSGSRYRATPASSISSAGISRTTSRSDFKKIVASLQNQHLARMSSSRTYGPLDPAKYSPHSSRSGQNHGSEERSRRSTISAEQTNEYAPLSDFKFTTSARYQQWIDNPRYSIDVDDEEKDSFDQHRDNQRAMERLEGRIPFTFDTSKAPTRRPGQSSSENNIIAAARTHKRGMSYSETPARAGSPMPKDTTFRGRSLSPVKYVDDDKDKGKATKPPKRDRSPIKKLLFGEGEKEGNNGRSKSVKEHRSPQSDKGRTGLRALGGKIMHKIDEFRANPLDFLPNPFTSKDFVASTFPVSLDPPAQAHLYMEVELMLCVTANTYLMIQRENMRMSSESLTKIATEWRNKSRPQVIEFHYDLVTQRELIMLNLKTFHFYGENQNDPVQINIMLQNWRALAREIAIRTFCYPDAQIRRHLHDIYKIIEMLGAPMITFMAFQEIQLRTLEKMKVETEKRVARSKIEYGIEKPWTPPPRGSSRKVVIVSGAPEGTGDASRFEKNSYDNSTQAGAARLANSWGS